jgi:hypothetical protein
MHKKGTNKDIAPSITSTNNSSKLSYCAATKGTENQDENSTPTINESNKFTTALTVLQSSTLTNTTSDRMVRFVDGSTAEMTMSTMSTNDRVVLPNQQTELTQLMEQQIKDITSAMSQKYESTIQEMKDTHIAQMNEIRSKQKEHAHDIKQLQNAQTKIKENLETKLDNKIEQQTNLLTSLVSMVHEMKEEKNKNDNLQVEPNPITTSTNTENVIGHNAEDLTDCSYSDEEDITENAFSSTQSQVLTIKKKSGDAMTVISQPEEETEEAPSSAQIEQQCEKHTNHIEHDDTNDIRRLTRSRTISNSTETSTKWKGISSGKRVTKIQHAIISPMKNKKKEKLYNKNSPSYNKYDPEGLIVKKNSDNGNDSDHSKESCRILRSGRRT